MSEKSVVPGPETSLGASTEGEAPGQQIAAPLLLQYWHVLIRWKWAIIGIVIGALALGIVVTLLTTPRYTAISRIEINREQQNVTKVEGLEPPQAGRDDEFYQTQYSLLAARSLATRVARKLRLASNTAFFAAHGVDLDSGLIGTRSQGALSAQERTKRESLAVDLLLKNVKIMPIARSRLVDIGYSSASPALSTDIANTWVEQFIDASLDRRFASTADARKFLENRLSDLRTRLETSERAVVQYASDKDIITLGRSTTSDGKTQVDRTLVSSDLEALNAALAQATAARMDAESKRASGSSVGDEARQSPTLAGLRQRRAEIASEYSSLLVQFEPEYPAAKARQEQLRTLDAAIKREEGRISAGRSAEFAEAARREAQLRANVEELKTRLDQQKRDSIQYNIYQREADTNRQLYDSLLQRYKEIGVAGVALSNIAIVDAARTPTAPSSPNLMLNLALALVAGLGLAFLSVIGLEQIDEGLRDPSAVGRQLQLPLLGGVPELEEDAQKALFDGKSGISEAYISIQSNLSFSTAHGFPKSLMMTSSRPAEGKTTSSIALAAVLGRTGKNVLLIDADMRSPSVHVSLGISNRIGLSNYLAGDDEWRGMVSDTPLKGVRLLSAGPMPPSAAELLSGERLGSLIRELEGQFDHVVVDSPPLLGLADAPLISRVVEGSVFVVESGGVAVRGLKAALARLQLAHARIYGVILTKISPQRSSYGYGQEYGYGSRETT